MKFQYGDSSDSPFEIDYLKFLEAAVECFVAALRAYADVCDADRECDQRRRRAASDADSIGNVGAFVRDRLEAITGGAAGECASAIARAAERAVGAELARVETSLRVDIGLAAARVDVATSKGVASLEGMLLLHDLPGANIETALSLHSGHYRARQYAETSYGVSYLVDIDVPSEGVFAAPVAVGSVAKNVVVDIPSRQASWSERLRRRTFDRMIVRSAVCGLSSCRISLRRPDGPSSEGLDITVQRGESNDVQLREVVQETSSPLDIDFATRSELMRFTEALEEQLAVFSRRRRKLLEVKLDRVSNGGASLYSFVERVIGSMAGDVAQIAMHSPSASEYVLRVQIGNQRREERYLSVSKLVGKVSPLPVSFHRLFSPILFPLGHERRLVPRGAGCPETVDQEHSAGSASHSRRGADSTCDATKQRDRNRGPVHR